MLFTQDLLEPAKSKLQVVNKLPSIPAGGYGSAGSRLATGMHLVATNEKTRERPFQIRNDKVLTRTTIWGEVENQSGYGA
jgi:hypothetical protein